MKKVFAGLLVIILVLSSGCIEKKEEEINSKSYPIYGIDVLPDNLGDNEELMNALFQGLVKYDGSQIVPALAESYTISKDGLQYTFKIRDEAFWSNGDKITADDFQNLFSIITAKNYKNELVSQLYCIYGLKQYNDGKCDFSSVAIKAVDRDTLTIRLNYPCSNLLNILCNSYFYLKDADLEGWKGNYTNINYTGAYVVGEINQEMITLCKNSKYYAAANVGSDKIVIKAEGSAEKALAAFETDNCDLITDTPESEIKRLIQAQSCEIIPESQLKIIQFNLKSGNIINNPDFRRILCNSFSIEDLLNNISFENVSIADFPGFTINENMDDVKKGLLRTKYNNEKLKFIYLDSKENKKIIDYLYSKFKKNDGININFLELDPNSFNKCIEDGSYDMALKDIEFNKKNEISFLENWDGSNALNTFGYNNYKFNQNIFSAISETNDEKREKLISESENLLGKDLPFIPLLSENKAICSRKNIKNLSFTPEGILILEKILIDNTSKYVRLPSYFEGVFLFGLGVK